MRVGSLFSGIGGLDLGLERAGMSVAWQCEIDPYCRAVLAHHWPGVRCYEDIREIVADAEWSGLEGHGEGAVRARAVAGGGEGLAPVDLICGGFPCQPVSLAGKGLAQADPRWLWPEFARVVGVLRPRYVLVENVPGLVRRGLGIVVGDLAALGYDAEWQIVSAASVGAPHLRERLIVVAYPTRDGLLAEGSGHLLAHPDRQLLDWGRDFGSGGRSEDSDRRGWASEPDVGRVADGVPNRVAQLRALGNAVVPQVAEFVGRLILEAETREAVGADA